MPDKLITLKRKVLTFRKACTDYTMTGHHEINGTSIIYIANDILKATGGYVCSFRDKDRYDFLKCKLVVKLPENEWANFVNKFSMTLMSYIRELKW